MNEIEKHLRSNKIFSIINEFESSFPEEFQKCGINKCGHCEGTGISNRHSLEFCKYCGGMGYRGFKKIDGEFVCRACNGYGCDRCNNKGTVDWIAYARGNDIIKGKYK